MPRENLFPLLVNDRGQATRHEFVGFWPGRIDPNNNSGDLTGPVRFWQPVFRCTLTGVDRIYGYLDADAPLIEMYGTRREYEV